MDFLKDEDLTLDLPNVTEISRDLFEDESEKLIELQKEDPNKTFDVDEFLIKNNFHYVPLDTLIRDLSSLSEEVIDALFGQVNADYDEYLKFCQIYSKDEAENETILDLQQTRLELKNFISHLEQLTSRDIARTQEVVSDTLEYLERLDHIQILLNNHSNILEIITLGKQLSKTLHGVCGIEPLEESISVELTRQLFILVTRARELLETLTSLNSPYVHHLRNEFQGLVQEFQISLKILTNKCLENPSECPELSKLLVEISQAA
ncbi:Golgi transport complex subunit COG2 NDAI_0G01010 [Naumovozyma dairenensis CBS 421]|uniref:Conserved oligomeric Golgi complex subunit 2 n=1 Tax=Naumovozyma dairenensis (strain ATCC 10597 / BCRC 20456 / CBS 421 / NBRC 0211 / NRRL Y-12639) TaxID=1071378 RepID=G0WDL6_NAUDC|nr:hypothetical protein NDAI_0G01010 [Naumovozyma dairenensis CBS 421]CCD25877.2 hypothetical protein NDAI_0G01010 [Naumovozyma dairenensis CBS 421]